MKWLGIAVLLFTSIGHAQNFNEIEPNNTPSTAQILNFSDESGTLSNGMIGSFADDYYRVNTAGPGAGITRFRMQSSQFSENVSYEVEGIGGTYLGGGGTRGAMWYSFRPSSSVLLRVSSNDPISTYDYFLGYNRFGIQTVNAGVFQPGTFRFRETNSLVSSRRLELHVFDASGQALTNVSSVGVPIGQFDFNAMLAPGTYFAAVGSRLASEHGSRTGQVLAPGLLAAEIAVANSTLAGGITLTSADRTYADLTGQRLGTENTIAFYQFTVVPEPASMIALGFGVLGLARRRKRRNA